MSYVVLGATGHLGTLTVDSLISRGVEPGDIVAAGRNAEKLESLAERGVRTQAIDLDQPGTLEGLFSEGDTVLLISANEVGRRVPQHAVAIDAAKAVKVGRLVYTSAPKADTSALVLAPEHKATEELIAASGIPATVLRNGWYTENYLQVAEQARQTGTVLTSAGDGRVASASRRDYAQAAAIALTDETTAGRTYELSGDVAWTQQDLADAIGEVIGKDVAVKDVSSEEHQAILVGAGLDEGTAGFVVALDANTRDGLLADTSGELAALLGRPTTPLVDGLREALNA